MKKGISLLCGGDQRRKMKKKQFLKRKTKTPFPVVKYFSEVG